jgi:hypothetical protein
MAQLDLWGAGRQLKEQGLDTTEMTNQAFVKMMRNYAIALCEQTGSVSSDDLRRYAATYGVRPAHSNAWGSIFRGKEWSAIGRIKSELSSNHAREIRVWTHESKDHGRRIVADLVSRTRTATVVDSREFQWFSGGDTGLSSKAIFGVMIGHPLERSYPIDWDDFGRCYRLLELFPEWRPRMHEVSERFPEWKPIVDRWELLSKTYADKKHRDFNFMELAEFKW